MSGDDSSHLKVVCDECDERAVDAYGDDPWHGWRPARGQSPRTVSFIAGFRASLHPCLNYVDHGVADQLSERLIARRTPYTLTAFEVGDRLPDGSSD